MKRISDFAVIGLGCAGMGAYLRLKKESGRILLFERGRVGGDLFHARLVENLLFSKSMRGADACRLMQNQAGNDSIIREECLSISEEKGTLKVKTEKGEYLCRCLVAATGREQKRISLLEGAQKHFASEAEGMKICIIGGGERALDCAASLIEKKKKVSVLSTGAFYKVNPLLLKETKRAALYANSLVKRIIRSGKYTVRFECGGEVMEMEFDDVIISTGTVRRLPCIHKEAKGRVLLAGSVRGMHLSQCALAFADGMRAGERAAKIIRSSNESDWKQED